ncbi:MAG TPA: helix-turn-helix transcriptional regulator [Trebonia sp.]|jgi:DNA-binding NarL/FixJ family response regulator|nr:helix-turn-helix transcriptional regulator [Trebonia sp.]
MISELELAASESSPGTRATGDRCDACGKIAPSGDAAAPGIAIRATIPQPIAAALRSAHRLSARERTVFQFLGAGYDNRSIARELGVSERTVKRHVTVILAKLRLESRLQAGLAALIISSSFSDGAQWP